MRHTLWCDYENLAVEAAGNWKKWQCFAWWEKPDHPEDWCIVYTSNRDSGLLDQSNEAAIAAILQPFLEADEPDIQSESHSHFLCGHVDGYAIRVFKVIQPALWKCPNCPHSWEGEDNECPECQWIGINRRKPVKSITEVFRAWCDIQSRLEDYSILDEEDLSNRQSEDTLDNIKYEGGGLLPASAPSDWPSQVYSWLSDYDQSEVESRDGFGGYPSKEAILAALLDLGIVRRCGQCQGTGEISLRLKKAGPKEAGELGKPAADSLWPGLQNPRNSPTSSVSTSPSVVVSIRPVLFVVEKGISNKWFWFWRQGFSPASFLFGGLSMTTKIDWFLVRAELNSQEWVEEDGRFERLLFLGTVFSLYPSGKYYTAWANSNVSPCPKCKGRGTFRSKECKHCGGMGSREAFLDAEYGEAWNRRLPRTAFS